MDPKKFAKRMEWYSKTFESNAGQLVDKVALTVHSTVVLATPVDTGRARGSWLVEVGKPAEGTADSPQDFGANAAITKARAKLGGNEGGSSTLRPQRDVHITNNLPYITPLNQGHSKQAPIGFVEQAIAAGQKQVKGTKLLSARQIGIGE
jgi:hypothetical protein